MARFNSTPNTPRRFSFDSGINASPTYAQDGPLSPVQATEAEMNPSTGTVGYLRGPKSELFLLAVSNMVGQEKFYESAAGSDSRYVKLVRELAVGDPLWTANLLRWMRGPDCNLRTASLVGAAEFVRGRLAAGVEETMLGERMDGGWDPQKGINRQVVDAVCQRADEPGEMLGYWKSRGYGIEPKPLKRGLADAVARLYSERSLLKYDTGSHGYRFGDVLDIVHPTAKNTWQSRLFKYALDRRHNRPGIIIPAELQILSNHERLMGMGVQERQRVVAAGGTASAFQVSGFTWEMLSSWLQGPMTGAAWDAIIPSMGYMALLRNLRNFDKAGISDESYRYVAGKLADPAEVESSRQLPMRFLSAYRAVENVRWHYPLELALSHSLSNVPVLRGRTLILVDMSRSMTWDTIAGDRSGLKRSDGAAIFGSALALRSEHPTLVQFGSGSEEIQVPAGGSLLPMLNRYRDMGGTATAAAVGRHYNAGHNRVVILTDEQYNTGGFASPNDMIPPHIPVYVWNLAGYRHGQGFNSATRHTFGGLSDACFRMLPLLEAGQSTSWPWEN